MPDIFSGHLLLCICVPTALCSSVPVWGLALACVNGSGSSWAYLAQHQWVPESSSLPSPRPPAPVRSSSLCICTLNKGTWAWSKKIWMDTGVLMPAVKCCDAHQDSFQFMELKQGWKHQQQRLFLQTPPLFLFFFNKKKKCAAWNDQVPLRTHPDIEATAKEIFLATKLFSLFILSCCHYIQTKTCLPSFHEAIPDSKVVSDLLFLTFIWTYICLNGLSKTSY